MCWSCHIVTVAPQFARRRMHFANKFMKPCTSVTLNPQSVLSGPIPAHYYHNKSSLSALFQPSCPLKVRTHKRNELTVILTFFFCKWPGSAFLCELGVHVCTFFVSKVLGVLCNYREDIDANGSCLQLFVFSVKRLQWAKSH